MKKKLIRVGNSLALLLDKPILDILGISQDTVLDVATDGRRIILTHGEGAMVMPDGSLVQMNILESLQDGGYHKVGCSEDHGWPARFGSRSETLIAEQVWHLIATSCIVLDPEGGIGTFVERKRKAGALPPAAPAEFIKRLQTGEPAARITGPGTDRLLQLRHVA